MPNSEFSEKAELIANRLRPLFLTNESGEEIKMLSYDRPAYFFWRKVCELLLAKGYTEEQIVTWFQSKGPRRFFDQNQTIFDVAATWMSVVAEVAIKEMLS